MSEEKDAGIPERIFLQVYGDQEPSDAQVDDADVTWSRERVFEHDVEYVRVVKPPPMDAREFFRACAAWSDEYDRERNKC